MAVLIQKRILGLLGKHSQSGFGSEPDHHLSGAQDLGHVRHTNAQMQGCVGNQCGVDAGVLPPVLATSLQFTLHAPQAAAGLKAIVRAAVTGPGRTWSSDRPRMSEAPCRTVEATLDTAFHHDGGPRLVPTLKMSISRPLKTSSKSRPRV